MDKHLIPYNLSEKFIKSHNNNINDYVMKIITNDINNNNSNI